MTIRVGGGSPIPGGSSSEGGEHKVRKGETMEGIANQYGVTADDLLKSNPQIKNPEKLRAGTRMFIPPFKTQTGAAPNIAKDGYEPAKPKTSLDQMMERPAGKNLPSGESRAFNFGKGEAQAWKSPGEAQAFGDPHAPVEAQAQKSPGEAQAFGDPHRPGEAQSFKNVTDKPLNPGEAQSWKNSGEQVQQPSEATQKKLDADQFEINNGKLLIKDEKLKGQ